MSPVFGETYSRADFSEGLCFLALQPASFVSSFCRSKLVRFFSWTLTVVALLPAHRAAPALEAFVCHDSLYVSKCTFRTSKAYFEPRGCVAAKAKSDKVNDDDAGVALAVL